MQKRSKLQDKAIARNVLFRQIHGYSLKPFIDRAKRENAITAKEEFYLLAIEKYKQKLIINKFENTIKVGLTPKHRCSICNNIARWKITMFGEERLYCNKCKEQCEKDNKQNDKGEWMITSIIPVNSK